MCNDDLAMVIHSLQSSSQTEGRVQSTASFNSFDVSGNNDPIVLIHTLEETPAGWRIAYIVNGSAGQEGYPSLLQSLRHY